MENASLSFDKRRHPRIKIQIPVKFQVINRSEEVMALLEQKRIPRAGDSKDVSAEGLFLISEQHLAKGDILKIEVVLPEESHPVRAFSEVVWTSDEGMPFGQHGSGIFFMALRDEDSEKIQRFVSKTLEGEK
jgi:hypothetical protein